MCEICFKLTTFKRFHTSSGVSIVDFEQVNASWVSRILEGGATFKSSWDGWYTITSMPIVVLYSYNHLLHTSANKNSQIFYYKNHSDNLNLSLLATENQRYF